MIQCQLAVGAPLLPCNHAVSLPCPRLIDALALIVLGSAMGPILPAVHTDTSTCLSGVCTGSQGRVLSL